MLHKYYVRNKIDINGVRLAGRLFGYDWEQMLLRRMVIRGTQSYLHKKPQRSPKMRRR